MLDRLTTSIRRSARYSLSVFVTYVLSAMIGAAMAHAGSRLALSHRDAVVERAARDASTVEYRAGHRGRAALADAAANFVFAACLRPSRG